MKTDNLKTFPGYIVGTEVGDTYFISEEEFSRCKSIMLRASGDSDITDAKVVSVVLNFPDNPSENDDAVSSVTPTISLFRAWAFHGVTAERFAKILVAAKLGLLSPKDACAMNIKSMSLEPYPDDCSYTIVAETKDGKQAIVREPFMFTKDV